MVAWHGILQYFGIRHRERSSKHLLDDQRDEDGGWDMGKQRLELTWYNKDKALIPTETGKYGYTLGGAD